MPVFEELSKKDHEQVIFCQDQDSGLKAIIAIHDTTLGPALGGCRMWPYNNEEDALRDVLRLSRGMTYKSAAAGLNLGGDPRTVGVIGGAQIGGAQSFQFGVRGPADPACLGIAREHDAHRIAKVDGKPEAPSGQITEPEATK